MSSNGERMTPDDLANRLLGRPVQELEPGLRERFAIYRSNYVGGLVGALEQTFPVVRLLVGSAYFEALACDYIAAHPPRSPVLARYGKDFASFLSSAPVARDVPYVADMAKLEFARLHAWHAADAPRWDAWSESGIAALLRRRIEQHPSLTVIASPYPIDTLWDVHQLDPPGMVLDWLPRTVAVHRNHEVVVHTLLDASAADALELILAAKTLDDALAQCRSPAAAQAALQLTLRLIMTEGLAVADQPSPAIQKTKESAR